MKRRYEIVDRDKPDKTITIPVSLTLDEGDNTACWYIDGIAVAFLGGMDHLGLLLLTRTQIKQLRVQGIECEHGRIKIRR